MLRGLAGIGFYADDMTAAREWYTRVLGVEPYFVRPAPPEPPGYLEWRLGDDQDELGILDRRYAPPGADNPPGGSVTSWHVDDLPAALDELLAAGATEYEPIDEQEGGFVTASVLDPFGNILGLTYSPHYLDWHSSGERRRESVPTQEVAP